MKTLTCVVYSHQLLLINNSMHTINIQPINPYRRLGLSLRPARSSQSGNLYPEDKYKSPLYLSLIFKAKNSQFYFLVIRP